MFDELQLPIDDDLAVPAPADDDLDACDRLPPDLERVLDELERDDD